MACLPRTVSRDMSNSPAAGGWGDPGGRESTENLIPRPPFQRMLCEPVGTTARSGEHFYSNFLVLYCSGWTSFQR